MANTIFSSEGALLFIMVATVALGFWLQRFKVFKNAGPGPDGYRHGHRDVQPADRAYLQPYL